MAEVLPWLESPMEAMFARTLDGRFPHALLVTGVPGLGKSAFAATLAKSLLCEASRADGGACGECPACTLTTAGTHPDLRVVNVDEEKNDIGVERVRDLTQFLTLTSQRRRGKVAIVDPAERMTISAANALLKTLEEPTADTVLLLVSSLTGELPATIRSRCQRVTLHPLQSRELHDWLNALGKAAPEWVIRQCGGAPLRLLEMLEDESVAEREAFFGDFRALNAGRLDVTVVCEGLDERQTRSRLGMLTAWIQDMLRLRVTSSGDFVRNTDLGTELASIVDGVATVELFRRLECAESAARLCGTSVNRQLLLEDTLLPWCAR